MSFTVYPSKVRDTLLCLHPWNPS